MDKISQDDPILAWVKLAPLASKAIEESELHSVGDLFDVDLDAFAEETSGIGPSALVALKDLRERYSVQVATEIREKQQDSLLARDKDAEGPSNLYHPWLTPALHLAHEILLTVVRHHGKVGRDDVAESWKAARAFYEEAKNG